MTALTRDAVTRILGPVDDTLAAEIIATGATENELREAHAWVANDDVLVDDLRPLPKGRVAELTGLLQPYSGPVTDDDA